MSENLVTTLFTFALNIPIFAIVLLFWQQLNKRREYTEMKTGTTIDKLKQEAAQIKERLAVLEERISWIKNKSDS